MTKFKQQGFGSTFRNARKGFRLVIKSEKNIRVHLVVASIVMTAGVLLSFDAIKFCILLLAISSVISAEMLNSAIEFTLDSVYHNKYNRMVGMAKDISAGAVMLCTMISISIGVILFGKSLIELALGHFVH
ncbi:TPA: diacylglycerol kinase [Candidatus Gastranaerophilales bacterium HUM_9]|nr:MAG TPA: diacylglycerol kinase [Candidatus Gastranaerophilales bacterium HUM_9]HBX35647.1 diacylglycerol kinase [Cyanobacteria bacterium UBA11440]